MGLSKSLDDPGMTLSGTVMGTPNYMSPEQAKGKTDINFRADMYSLGATLYHMVTGRMPFQSNSVVEVLQKQANEALPDPREFNPEISEACVQLTEIVLAKDPEQRYPDWATLTTDVDRAMADKRPSQITLAAGQSVLLRSAAPHEKKVHDTSVSQQKPKKRRSMVSLIAAAVAVVVIAAGVGATALVKKRAGREKRMAAFAEVLDRTGPHIPLEVDIGTVDAAIEKLKEDNNGVEFFDSKIGIENDGVSMTILLTKKNFISQISRLCRDCRSSTCGSTRHT